MCVVQRRPEIFGAILELGTACWERRGEYVETMVVSSIWALKDMIFFCSRALQVCFRCTATKGTDNLETCYTNIATDALWRTDAAPNLVWSTEPAAARLHGFSLRMVAFDLLHVCHLGILRDLVGSGFKLLTRKKGEYFSGRNITKRLAQLTSELKMWAKGNNVQLSLTKINRKTLNWKSDACPELRVKGADAAACLRFLSWKLQAQAPLQYPSMVICTWAAERFISCLVKASIFLSEEERATAFETGQLFLRSYLQLANRSLEFGELLYKTRPKLHCFTHIVDDLQREHDLHQEHGTEATTVTYRNPFFDATFVDEDWVKHAMQMKKKMAHRTASLNVLRRFAVVTKTALDKATR